MVTYIQVEVQIHGIARNEPEDKQSLDHIQRRIASALRKEFHTQFDDDIEVTLLEYAGEVECSR